APCVTQPDLERLSVVDPYWEVLDPKPDIHALFHEYNRKFFRGQLPPIDLKWSNRLSLNAGYFKYEAISRRCSIRLNKPLLDLRSRKDTVEIDHDFYDEYESLKRHSWRCNGPCAQVVRRVMDRTPYSKGHKRECGGEFIKIQEPDDSPPNKRMRLDQ
ncbi:hypothetical protein XELAEV_18045535mg, partial [Xenopus laevis]